MRAGQSAPCAALLTSEGERHTLGLSLAELVLAEAGWCTVWIGEGPPAADLAALATGLKPSLIVCAASAGCAPSAVRAYQAALTRLCEDSGTRLMLAGSGAWEEADGVSRVVTFDDLRAELAGSV